MNQKLENILNLALEATPEERFKSQQLGVGFSEETRTWELIVKYNGDIGRLGNELIRVEELIAGYAIVTIPENLIDTFSQLDEIEYVEKPKRLYFSIQQGKEASCIFSVTARDPFLTGRGVLIAIIDSGIDYESPEFRDEQGRSRILFLWDQTLVPSQVNALLPEGYEEFAQSAAPEGFVSGVEFSASRINAALESGMAERIVPSRDISGHGTSVAAIAAAGGHLQGGRYQGVAPESELLIVKMGNPAPNSFPRTTELMRALTYVVKKAVELEKPLAVNLSFGNTYGAHDGTSLLERFMDNVSEIGRTVICVGSGNEGGAAGHVAGSFGLSENPGESRRIELSIGSYQTGFSIQFWKTYADIIEMELTSPGGASVNIRTLEPGGRSYRLDNTEVLLFVGEPAPYSVNQEIYLDLLPIESYVNQGIWTLTLTPVRTITGNYDLYLPSSSALNVGTRFFTPNPSKTLTIPSTSSRVITVAAYQAGFDAYAEFSGRGYPLQSVPGGRILGNDIKPDIAAPGVNISTIGPAGTSVQVTGTSFATPFVTGSAALMMEWGIIRGNDVFLYGEKLKAYLRRGARFIRGENEYPNERVGFGALCVRSSLPE